MGTGVRMIEGAIAGVVTMTLTEGVRFLYQQAQELISARRARRTADVTEAPPEDVFVGEVRLAPSDPAVLDEHAADFDRLLSTPGLVRLRLGHAVDPEDAEQMRAAADLRELLETVTGRRIAFVGEAERPESGGTVITGTATAKRVSGVQSGVDADEISGGARVSGGSVVEDEVAAGGDSAGVRVKKVTG